MNEKKERQMIILVQNTKWLLHYNMLNQDDMTYGEVQKFQMKISEVYCSMLSQSKTFWLVGKKSD